jgi:hypothetical protein
MPPAEMTLKNSPHSKPPEGGFTVSQNNPYTFYLDFGIMSIRI